MDRHSHSFLKQDPECVAKHLSNCKCNKAFKTASLFSHEFDDVSSDESFYGPKSYVYWYAATSGHTEGICVCGE